jgi:leucyl aminopeptidase
LLLLLFTEAPASSFAEALSDTLGSAVERAMQGSEAEEGQARVLYPEQMRAPRMACPGFGPASELDAGTFRTAAAAGADTALEHEADAVACPMPVQEDPGDERTARVPAKLEEPLDAVDLATLTGTCVVALGQAAAGGTASETGAAAERLHAIQRTGERTGGWSHHGGKVSGASRWGLAVASPRHRRSCVSAEGPRVPSQGGTGAAPGGPPEQLCSGPRSHMMPARHSSLYDFPQS